jgi:hypothetical protein
LASGILGDADRNVVLFVSRKRKGRGLRLAATFPTGHHMTDREQTSGGRTSSRRFLPVLGVFAGGLVHSVLPLGAFGTYDVAARVALVGIVAGVTSVMLFVLTKRWDARKERS